MPSRHVSLKDTEPPALREGLRRLRAGLGVPGEFPADVQAEAERAAAAGPVLASRDCTDIEFVTLDPEGSTDLDQAFHLSRVGSGYLLRYAIADVAAFVAPGGRLDAETHRARARPCTRPPRKIPLHPAVLSEGAASLLPDQTRPALVWELSMDATGALTDAQESRAERCAAGRS